MKKATASSILGTALLLTVAVLVHAQQPSKLHRIGFLSPRSEIHPDDEAFRERLRELGYVDGRNLSIEWRFTQGKAALYTDLAAELVRLRVDCLIVSGIRAAHAAKQASATIPIVMANASDDPVRQGLVASLAQPGGNITGFTDMASELAGRRLELLKEAIPKVSRVAHLSDRTTPPGPADLKEIEVAARALGCGFDLWNCRVLTSWRARSAPR